MAITKHGRVTVQLDRLPHESLELEYSDLHDQSGVVWHHGEVILPQADGTFVVARSGDGPFSDENWVPGRVFDTLAEAQRRLDDADFSLRKWLGDTQEKDVSGRDYLWVLYEDWRMTMVTAERVKKLTHGAEPLSPVETWLAANRDWCRAWLTAPDMIEIEVNRPLPEWLQKLSEEPVGPAWLRGE